MMTRTTRRTGRRKRPSIGAVIAVLVPLVLASSGCTADTREQTGSESETTEQHSSTAGTDAINPLSDDEVRSSGDSIGDREVGSPDRHSGTVVLSQSEFIVEDTATAASLRLYVRNTTGKLAVIDRVDPSCGCIMTTVQRRNARPGDSAEIYIGFLPQEMSSTQPYTVDVYMSTDPSKPLRLTIWKREAWENRD